MRPLPRRSPAEPISAATETAAANGLGKRGRAKTALGACYACLGVLLGETKSLQFPLNPIFSTASLPAVFALTYSYCSRVVSRGDGGVVRRYTGRIPCLVSYVSYLSLTDKVFGRAPSCARARICAGMPAVLPSLPGCGPLAFVKTPFMCRIPRRAREDVWWHPIPSCGEGGRKGEGEAGLQTFAAKHAAFHLLGGQTSSQSTCYRCAVFALPTHISHLRLSLYPTGGYSTTRGHPPPLFSFALSLLSPPWDRVLGNVSVRYVSQYIGAFVLPWPVPTSRKNEGSPHCRPEWRGTRTF